MNERVGRVGLAFLALAIPVAAEWDDSLLRPFVIHHRSAAPSRADVSFLLDPPAGKEGFIQVRNGRFTTAAGRRIRFWGVNVTDWSKGSVMLPSKQDAPVWAAALSRFGVNLVRLHFLDLFAPRGLIDGAPEDSRSFDAAQLDRLDFWVAELKKRGIYVNLNLNVGRSYKRGDGVADYDKIRWAKGLVLFNPRLIELQKEYARQILTHRNPYTGNEYRHEPAVALVEILNENALYAGFRAPTPYYDEQLTRLYNAWLEKHRAPEERAAIRQQAGVAEGEPVPRLKAPEVAAAPKERFEAEMAFFMELEDRFYQDMYRYLRETVGVRVPIVATADHSHSGSSYPMLATISKLDVLDGHAYWQHPGTRSPKTPMVNDPLNSTVVRLARTAVAGKPYTVSETNHPFPNDYAAEGIPILAAYGGFQDWDAIVMYTFEPKLAADAPAYVGDPFDISLDPVRMPQMASGALMFLRADLRPARKTITRTYSTEQVIYSRRLPRSKQPFFTPGFPPWIALRHAVRIGSFDGPPNSGFFASRPTPLVSDTQELVWDTSGEGGGLLTVQTDRTEALIGFVREHPRPLRHLVANLRNRFAALVLSCLEPRAIAECGKLLLTAGSRVANTGMTWDADRTRATNWGGPPTLVEPVTGSLTLRGLRRARSVRAWALDGAGQPIADPIRAIRSGPDWILSLGDPVTTWYVVEVSRP
jgi:hypothetical protein